MNEGQPIIIKKKKIQGHGHHGGAWKVAYADFVTAMMAFFLVMWIMGMDSASRESVEGYFNDPVGFMKVMPKGPPNIGPSGGRTSPRSQMVQGNAARLLEEDRKKIEALESEVEKTLGQGTGQETLAALIKNIEVNITPEGLEIEFVEGKGMVFFEVGSAIVRPEARQLILSVAPKLAGSGRMMFIDGHTDARPFGGGEMDNKMLSLDRARSVYRLLRAGGVPERQVMAIRGQGSRKLKLKDLPLDARNRRVSVLLPFAGTEEQLMSDLPANAVDGSQAAFKEIQVVPEPVRVAP